MAYVLPRRPAVTWRTAVDLAADLLERWLEEGPMSRLKRSE
ncbi:MAG TPA: hypothetical protein VNC50_02615 [Planctomycetia bacterium]|nr:hypothetical protein [Planctomycetia bacterium]